MSLITTIAVSNCRLATKDGEAMFFDEVVDFSAYAGALGDTPYYLELLNADGKKCTGYCAGAGGGLSLGDEAVSAWNNSSVNPFETFTTAGVDISSAINTVGVGRCGTTNSALSAGSIYQWALGYTLNSGAPAPYLAQGITPTSFSLLGAVKILAAGANTGYVTTLATTTCFGIISVNGDMAFSGMTAKKLTDVPVTGLHLVSTYDGSTRNVTVDAGFDRNAIASVKVYDSCVFKASNTAFGSWADQVSGAVPAAQGNGRRWTIADLDAGVVQALGSFTPSDVPQTECDALIAFYAKMSGDLWTNGAVGSGADAWMNSRVVNDWYGVSVVGGHITGLALPGNNLDGDAGTTLDPLAGHLATLDLGQNTALDDISLPAQTALNDVDLAGCDFGSSVVAGILADLVTAGVASGTLDIGGSNSAPTPAGVTSLHTLETAGVTVTYSTILMENAGSFYAITADGDATIRSSDTDFSGQTGKYIVLRDTAGKYAYAYGHGADDAEAFGAELVINGDFSVGTDWNTGTEWGIGGGVAIYDGTDPPQGLSQASKFNEGYLFLASIKVNSISGALRICFGSTAVFGINITTTGTHTRIQTAAGTTLILRGYAAMQIDDASVKKYIALGTDALQLRNASTGSTRNFTSIDAGFNPNAINRIEVFNA